MTNQIQDDLREFIDTKAPAIGLSELTAVRARLHREAGVRRTPRVHSPVRGRAALAGVAVAALAGTGVVVAAHEPGQARPARHSPAAAHSARSARSARPVMLTTAAVRRIAHASHVALAKAGHVLVTYSDVTDGIPNGSGTYDITFSGHNYNDVSRQPGTKPFISRAVNGQIYLYFDPGLPGKPLQWYHSIDNPFDKKSARLSVPDPRKLVKSLTPGAGLELIGWQVIDGVRLEHLRATNLKGLSAKVMTLESNEDDPLSSLNLWVSRDGVVQLLRMKCSGRTYPYDYPDVDTVSVRFLDIGKPESITAPAHYVNMVTHG